MTLRVNLDEMLTSAVHLTNQGEDLAIGHAESDATIVDAQVGWQGMSAQAMGAKVDTWAQTSATLLSRLSDHAQGLHASAHAFATNEDQQSQAFESLAETACAETNR